MFELPAGNDDICIENEGDVVGDTVKLSHIWVNENAVLVSQVPRFFQNGNITTFETYGSLNLGRLLAQSDESATYKM